MRLTIQHETLYTYTAAPNSVIEVLRLTPTSTDTQTVRTWRIDVTGDAVLRRSEDAFGNITHTFTLPDPGEALTITATGTVETDPTTGIVGGTRERQPRGVFMRTTPLTEPDAAIAEIVATARAEGDGSTLDLAHRINLLVHRAIAYIPGTTTVATPAADALAAGSGVCQDLAHILLAAARHAGLPARYVSGYRFTEDRPRDQHDPHAWVEIFVDKIGWISFDPTVGASATNAYVRIAIGLDYMSASPVRGAVYGGAGEELGVKVTIDHTGSFQPKTQSQTQGGQSQTQGGQSQTQGGQSQSQGGQSQSQGGQSQSQGGQSQTQGGQSQTQGGQSQTQGGQSRTTQGGTS